MGRTTWIVLSLLVSFSISAHTTSEPAATADPPDNCTFDALTDGCKVFSSDGPEFLANGIPNFPALLKESRNLYEISDQSRAKADEDSKETLTAQMKIRDFMERMAAKAKEEERPFLSEAAQQYFVAHPLRIGRILTEAAGRNNKARELDVPWPLDSENFEMSHRQWPELNEKFRSFFSPEELTELRAMMPPEPNPFELRNPENSKKLNGASDERVAQVRKLVEDIRADLIRVIRNGKTDAELSPGQKAAIEKVRTIQVTPPDAERLRQAPSCNGASPNAFYQPLAHSINLCPNFYKFPDAAIVPVLAHEMAHSIDPCLFQFPTYAIHPEQIAAMETGNPPRPLEEMKKDEPLMRAYYVAKGFEDSNSPYTSMPLPLQGIQQDLLVSRGIVTPIAEGVPLESSPFQPVYACLKSEAGGDFRAMDLETIKTSVHNFTTEQARRAGELGIEYKAVEDEARIVRALQSYPECVGTDSHSQMGEAFADWMGAEVAGGYMARTYPQGVSGEDRLLPVAFFSSLACYEKGKLEKRKNPEEETASETMNRYFKDSDRQADAHPSSVSRIDEIMLRQPLIRKALGCNKPGEAPCTM